jgi:DNA-binding NtrC family response regulator
MIASIFNAFTFSDNRKIMEKAESTFFLLMVDYEPAVLASIKRLFFKDNYSIHTASSAPDALDLLRKVRIDAALVDLKMPGVDGLALLKKIRAKYSQIMVIMLTGHGGVKEAVEAIKLSAYEKMAFQNALSKSGGNRKKAVRILSIGEATLYRKLRNYQI